MHSAHRVGRCIALLTFLALPASAAQLPDDIAAANNQFTASFALRHLSYTEYNNGAVPSLSNTNTLDSDSGWLIGSRLEWHVQRDVFAVPNLYFAASFEQVWGDADYSGFSQQVSGGSVQYRPMSATNGESIMELGAALGVGFPIGRMVALTPLVRYGFRNWHRQLQKGTSQQYLETYTHHEIGAGALFQITPVDRLVLGADASLGATVAPGIDNHLFTPLSLEMDLGNSIVFRGGVFADFAIWKHLRGGFRYGVSTFTYGASNLVTFPASAGGLTIKEPDSTTFEHELRFTLGGSF